MPSPTPAATPNAVSNGPEPFPGIYHVMRGLARAFFFVFGGRSVHGTEYIPKTGAAIIAANHVSMADPPLIPSSINDRPVYIMAKEELFKVPILGWALTSVGTFPVKRGTADRAALKTALGHLEAGHLLLLFPEGARGDGVTLQEPQRGLGLIALKSGAPIIPCYVDGTARLLPRGGKIPKRTRVSVTFGPPIDSTVYKGIKGGDEALGKVVMDAIASLRDHQKSPD